MRAVRSNRGVTLIELAVVFALITVLTALSVAALNGLKSRASFSATSNEVVSMVRKTKIEALNRGTYTIFVINQNTTGASPLGYWSIQTDQPIATSAALKTWLNTFAGAPTSTCAGLPGCDILGSGSLPGGTTATFAGTYGSALPAPFASLATMSSTCSFCTTSGPSNWGAVMFSPGGTVIFSNEPTAGPGAHFSLTGSRDINVARVKTVAIIKRTGLIEAYEK
jgi:type II secretory pathway pseudopilin PulG